MTLRVNVAGGTDGCRRIVYAPRQAWRCPECKHENPGYRGFCGSSSCSGRRPKETR